MNPSQAVRFAIIGCGYIGKRHAEVIMDNADAQLIAVCDTDLSQSEKAKEWNVPFFDNLEDLLSHADFDVLCVATPNAFHAAHAIAGLEADKHVVIEKPMALKRSDCAEIVRLSESRNRKVFAVMQNRYSPPSVWLKNLLRQGVLGKIYMVQIACYWNRDQRYYKGVKWKGKAAIDGGTLFTQFSHFVDMMYWLFGDISNIQSKFMDFNHADLTDFEDSGHVVFDFVNGGMGTFSYSTSVWDTNMESSITIIAEQGSVKIGGQYMNTVEYCHIKAYTMPQLEPSNPPNDYGTHKGSASNHKYFYDNVIQSLHSDAPITTNAEEGMKVVEIIERIYESNPYFKLKHRNEDQ